MRILTVSAVMGAGGAEVVTDIVLRDLVERGHHQMLASGGGFRADRLEADGIPHVRLTLGSRRPRDLASSVVSVRRACARFRPDVIHAHNVKATVVARLAAGTRTPVLSTMHGVPASQARTATRLLRGCATHVVAVSAHVADVLISHGFAASRLSVIPNAVAPVAVAGRDNARDVLGIPADRPVVLVLARLAQQKRHDLLIAGWPDVGHDAILLIAGDGPRRDALHRQVRDLAPDVAERIVFLGERTDVGTLLGAADLLALPTDWEGLPISLLEALGAGVPAVVSDVGGVSALADGLHLVSPNSASAFAAGVRHLLADSRARAHTAQRGRRLIERQFSPAAMHTAYAELCNALAARPDHRTTLLRTHP